ncbi:MAG: class I SAM-dependent methyltransferase [Gammaproteobacteria bacterium]
MSRSADPSTAEHSERLLQLIRDRISAAGGWLPFSSFMELALYAPGLGYYSAGSVKLGAAGDFVTAPEVSDLFGACVARQCAQVLATTGGDILEFGAGTGRLASAVLTTLDALPDRYLILEVSADLRERQQRNLASLPATLRERVIWLERLPTERLRGVVLANEVLDALPFERFIVRDGVVHAFGVALEANGAVVAREGPADAPLAAAAARLLGALPQPLPDGYTTELSLRIPPWIATLGQHLERGVALIFDYGLPRAQLYHLQRTRGTLRCHFRHRAHDDPLVNVGLQDITAWVDFTAVAEAASDAGLEVLGFATQAAFLLGSGIDASLQAAASSTLERARHASEARRLLLPGEMGEVFKVIALGLGYDRALAGFSVRDLRGSL